MDHLQKFSSQIRIRQVFLLVISNGIIIGGWWAGSQVLGLDALTLLWALVGLALIVSVIFAALSSGYLTKPIKLVWQAVMHVAPETANVPAPSLKSTHLGTELLTSLINHVYQLAHVVDHVEKASNKHSHGLKHDFVANSLPLPLTVLDKNQNIMFANKALADYLESDVDEIVGKNAYTLLDMSFSSKDTLDQWLTRAKTNKAVDSASWERVRIRLPESKTVRQFDLAAYYNKNNPSGFETMLVLFDHSERYGHDDQDLSFVSLAVHELRTPITLLRGYIEALEEELEGKLDPELDSFMHKMKSSAQHLTIFINNILNVARIEGDQLTLKLHQEEWPRVIQSAVNDMELRARVRNVELETQIPDNLPPVGIDSVSTKS
jgi:signal transduction histidine kinase